MEKKICVVGLGYVGLPVAVAFDKYFDVIGFDINPERINQLRDHIDQTGEVKEDSLRQSSIRFTDSAQDLEAANFYIVTVPTPIDENACPDLRILEAASKTVGRALSKGDIVVYESTVYPGVTEDICGPILEQVSGLTRGTDFFLGYSPERINPGDKVHTFENIIKIVSGENADTLQEVADVYSRVVKAGVHQSPSIKVAETAKVLENTQRDVNIALMNEVALILERMDISTKDVLDAAGTKWNFLNFHPGLVGGHCIGVDPFYLTAKAKMLGYHPEVILAGRRINDGMGKFIAQRLVKLFAKNDLRVRGAKVGILGLTFKENVPDLRNSRVPDIVRELGEFGIKPLVHDAMATPDDIESELGLKVSSLDEFSGLDALILAVNHNQYVARGLQAWAKTIKPRGLFIDVKSVFHADEKPEGIDFWAL